MNPEARKIVPEQKAEKIPDFNERVSQKSEKLEQTKQAFEKGDTSSISPEEIQNLKSQLPGFIKMIKGRMQDIQNETNDPNSTEANKKIESLQRLLAASETMQQYFESQNQQSGKSEPTSTEEKKEKVEKEKESARFTIEVTKNNLEKYKNIEEIVNKLLERTEKLKELISKLDGGNIEVAEKIRIEAELESLLKDIEELTKQLEQQPDELNPEDRVEMERLDSEISKLEEEINSNPISAEAQEKRNKLIQLSGEYQELQGNITDSLINMKQLNTAVNNNFNSIKEPKNINLDVKNRMAEVLSNSGTDFREKFRRIEQNIGSGAVK